MPATGDTKAATEGSPGGGGGGGSERRIGNASTRLQRGGVAGGLERESASYYT